MKKKYLDIRVTALSDEDIKDFLVLLRMISECGKRGMSRTINVHVDGDGSGNYEFDIIKGANVDHIIKLDEKEVNRVSEGDANFEIYLGE